MEKIIEWFKEQISLYVVSKYFIYIFSFGLFISNIIIRENFAYNTMVLMFILPLVLIFNDLLFGV